MACKLSQRACFTFSIIIHHHSSDKKTDHKCHKGSSLSRGPCCWIQGPGPALYYLPLAPLAALFSSGCRPAAGASATRFCEGRLQWIKGFLIFRLTTTKKSKHIFCRKAMQVLANEWLYQLFGLSPPLHLVAYCPQYALPAGIMAVDPFLLLL